jgi:hypothetical protein
MTLHKHDWLAPGQTVTLVSHKRHRAVVCSFELATLLCLTAFVAGIFAGLTLFQN